MEITNFWQLCLFVVELTKAIVCMNRLCDYQFVENAKRRLIILSVISLSIISIIMIVYPKFELIDSVYVLLIFIITLTVFRGKKVKIGVVFFISYLCITIVDIFIFILMSKFLENFFNITVVDNLGLTLINSISLVLLILIVIILKNNKKANTFPMAKLHWSFYILIIWILISFTIMISYFQYLKFESNTDLSLFLVICMLILSLGMAIIILMITKVSYSRDKFKALSKINQEYLDMQQQYYILLSEKNKDIRRFRHDIKNHLICMQTLFEEDNTEEVKKYLRDLAGGFQETIPKINTGSNIVDAIMNDKLMKNPELIIIVKGYLPAPMHINAIDLCTIFSNTLTNAIEAVKNLEDCDKVITFDLKNLADNIVIKVSNPVAKKVMVDGNRINTSKIDKSCHGFGLENIKESVNKYKGTMELNSMEEEFMIEITLKNKS